VESPRLGSAAGCCSARKPFSGDRPNFGLVHSGTDHVIRDDGPALDNVTKVEFMSMSLWPSYPMGCWGPGLTCPSRRGLRFCRVADLDLAADDLRADLLNERDDAWDVGRETLVDLGFLAESVVRSRPPDFNRYWAN